MSPHHCEDCHRLQYDDEELCGCGSGSDSLGDDFWNMTLDDLDHISTHSSSSKTTPTKGLPSRRHSTDGVIGEIDVDEVDVDEVDVDELMARRHHSCTGRSPRRSRSVTFGKVQAREYERVLGDNPACLGGGCSLSIGWNSVSETEIDLESWESQRKPTRRSSSQFLLSPEKRNKIAQKSGYTRKDIEENIKRLAKHQKRRERTLKEVERDSLTSMMAQGLAQRMGTKKTVTLKSFLQAQQGMNKKTTSSRSSADGAAKALPV